MNIVEIKAQLVDSFMKKPTLDVSEFGKFKLPEGLEPVRESLIRGALKDLEEMKFIRSASKDGPDIVNPVKSAWILEAPLGYSGQDVTISMHTAYLISSFLNKWREANEIEGGFSNILAIDEDDLVNLANIANAMAMEDKEDDENK